MDSRSGLATELGDPVQDKSVGLWGLVFKKYEEFQDGNRRAFNQAQGPSEDDPGVTESLTSHDTGPATNQSK